METKEYEKLLKFVKTGVFDTKNDILDVQPSNFLKYTRNIAHYLENPDELDKLTQKEKQIKFGGFDMVPKDTKIRYAGELSYIADVLQKILNEDTIIKSKALPEENFIDTLTSAMFPYSDVKNGIYRGDDLSVGAKHNYFSSLMKLAYGR